MVVTSPPESPVTLLNDKPLAARLSKNIASRRHALGLTQAQLAEQLGVDTETLSRFERGKHLPSLERLEHLAGILLTTIGELLAEKPKTADDKAFAVTAWLTALTPDDQAFALQQLKQCCDHLGSRQPAPLSGKVAL